MTPEMRARFIKAGAFVVATGDDDRSAQNELKDWFERTVGEEGHTYLLICAVQLFVQRLKSEHGEHWAGELMKTVHEVTERNS